MDENLLRAFLIIEHLRISNKKNVSLIDSLDFLENLIVELSAEASKVRELESKLVCLSKFCGVQ